MATKDELSKNENGQEVAVDSKMEQATEKTTTTSSPSSSSVPRFSLVIVNIQKRANVRALLNAATAFGCYQILLVGQSNNLQKKRRGSGNGDNPDTDGNTTSSGGDSLYPKQFQKYMIIPQTNDGNDKEEEEDDDTNEKGEGEENNDDSNNSKPQVILRHFLKWKECLEYIQQNSIYLIGVEIDAKSKILNKNYHLPTINDTDDGDTDTTTQQQKKQHGAETIYRQDIAIMMGNEGQGIHPTHLKSCQELIRIPQYGVGTASLNVNVAANIILYRFHHLKRNHHQEQKEKQEH